MMPMRIPRLTGAHFLFALPLVAQYYVASTVVGNGQLTLRTGGAALESRLVAPRYATVAPNGDAIVSDSYFNQVYRISGDGLLRVMAGTGRQGAAGDNGPAIDAQLDSPGPVLVDGAGNVLIADQANGRLRRVAADGVITTVANVGSVAGMTFDAGGNLYYTLTSQHVIRRRAADGTDTLIAGGDTAGFAGDGGQASAARLAAPVGLRFDAAGNLYFADSQNHRVRRITPAGIISTIAGTGTAGFSGDGGPAAAATLASPNDVAVDGTGVIVIVDGSNGRIRSIDRLGVIRTMAGGGDSNANGPALSATLAGIQSISLDASGNVLFTVPTARVVRRLSSAGTVTTIAGFFLANQTGSAPALSTTLLDPFGVAVDGARNLIVSDAADHRVLRVTPEGALTVLAGNGVFGNTGNDGPAAAGAIGAPRAMVYDGNGNLFVASGAGATVRRITPAGVISLITGSGPGYAGDGGPALQGRFLDVTGIGYDTTASALFIADTGNQRVRRIDAGNRLSTFAGNGTRGFAGDGGPAEAAQLAQPRNAVADRAGRVYISDTANHRVRRVGRDGIVTTIAGNGNAAFSGDGGAATAAGVPFPLGLAVDTAGNLFIGSGNRIRRVDGVTGVITTIAGGNAAAFAGDGGLATNASFDTPMGLAVDDAGVVYVADSRNYRVRKLTPARIVAEGVAHGATLRAGGLAPGMIASIFGFELGPANAAGLRLDSEGRVATELAGTRVFFDDIPAPILFTSAGQVNVVTPYGVRGERTSLRVEYQGRATNTVSVPVVASSPGLFAVTNQDGAVNAAGTPAAAGSVLILYGTGEGQTSPAGVDGAVANEVFPKPVQDVSITIGGRPAALLYAGAAPGFVSGVLQVNVQIPAGVTGTVPLVVRIGEAASPPRNIFVR